MTTLTLKQLIGAMVRELDRLPQRYAAAKKGMRNMTPGMLRGYMRSVLLDLGWLGIAGVGILAMCMALYFSALRPAQQRLQTLINSISQLGQPGVQTGVIVEGGLAPEEQLAVFYSSFPQRSSMPVSLGKIYAAAASEGLALEQADYKASLAIAGKLTRYQLNLPIRGEYSRIHKFLVRVLREVPSASLERVLFERKKIDDSAVDATVTLVLHLGPES